MRKIKASDVVQDLSIYPRCAVDKNHVATLALVLDAGNGLPPIVICRKTRKVIDGFHRLNAHAQRHGWESEIEVIEKDYADTREMWLDSIRFNAKHGLPLTALDREQCVLKCKNIGVNGDELSLALGVLASNFGTLTANNIAAVLTPKARAHRQEDMELLELVKSGDEGARVKLLAKYHRMLHKFAIQRAPTINDRDDYFQKAAIYFLEAIERFDPSIGANLSTYLYSYVGNKLLTDRRSDGLVRHPVYDEAQAVKQSRETISIDGKDGEKSRLQIEASGETDHHEADSEDASALVREALTSLPPRERDIIERRMDGEILSEIGESQGVTRERIRQIEERAIARLVAAPALASRRREAFDSHVDWLIDYVEENAGRLGRDEIEKLTTLSLRIDDLTEAAA